MRDRPKRTRTFAASGDRATPRTTPTATFVTMSGAIVTIAQIEAARAAAAAITTHRRRVDVDDLHRSRVRHPPRPARSPSVRYGGMPSATGTVERRSYRLTGTAALTIVGTIVGLVVLKQVFVAAHRPISWAAAAVAAAVLIDPIVDRLAVHIRRVPAVLLTFLAIGVVGVGITYLVFDEVEQAVRTAGGRGPEGGGDHRGPRRQGRRAGSRLPAQRARRLRARRAGPAGHRRRGRAASPRRGRHPPTS